MTNQTHYRNISMSLQKLNELMEEREWTDMRGGQLEEWKFQLFVEASSLFHNVRQISKRKKKVKK